MPNRMISLERNTNETQIDLTLDLDGTGRYEVDTGCGFLNHMLELFARHGRFDLVLTCHGDVQVVLMLFIIQKRVAVFKAKCCHSFLKLQPLLQKAAQ